MSTTAVIMGVTVLLLLSCGQPRAGSRSTEQRGPATSSAGPSPAQGTISHGEVAPQKGKLPPAPDLTPEEGERLLQRTMRKVPDGPPSDTEPSSPADR